MRKHDFNGKWAKFKLLYTAGWFNLWYHYLIIFSVNYMNLQIN